jgi:cytochrome c oxidase subunit 2
MPGEDGMPSKNRLIAPAVTILGALALLLPALAGRGLADEPRPWEIGMQVPASEAADRIAAFHSLLLWIITAITLFVLGLLVYVVWRFRESRNPVPTRTSHHTVIEVIWTVLPIMILVIIAIPSFKLLYYEDRVPDAALTVKAIGHQWYWSYEYPDNGKFAFDSQMIEDADLKPGQLRLLEVDNRMVLPVNTNVRVVVASDDVIHAWIVPSLGVQVNAVPGRLNELWVNIDREGVYYGQCTQLCGINHGFMPIVVEAMSKEKFASWAEGHGKKKAAAAMPAPAPARVAAGR